MNRWIVAGLLLLVASLGYAQMPGIINPMMAGGGAPACTPNDQGGGTDTNVFGLFHFENSAVDSSGLIPNGTLGGTATFSNTQSKFGNYSLLPGSAGAMTIPFGLRFTDDFTIETWLYFTTAPAATFLTVSSDNVGTYEFGNVSGGQRFWVPGINNTWGTNNLAANSWFHYAWVRQGTTGTNLNLYINGVKTTASGSFPMNQIIGGANAWAFGGRIATGGTGALNNAFIDELRISNVARYTADFTPQITPFCNPVLVGNPWNPFDRNVSAVLSNNNYDVISPGDSQLGGVRTVKGFTSGKWYWEIKSIVSPTYFTTMGIANRTMAFGNYIGALANSAGFRPGVNATALQQVGWTLSNGFTMPQNAVGDVVQFALDMDNKRAWFGRNNVWFGTGNPDPATGTAPNITGITDAKVFPAIAPYWAYGGQDKHTLQDGKVTPFTYTPPAGFSALGNAPD